MDVYKGKVTTYIKYHDRRTGDKGGAHFPDVFGELTLKPYKSSLRMFRLLAEAPEMLRLLEGMVKAKKGKKAPPDLAPVHELLERLRAPQRNYIETGEVL